MRATSTEPTTPGAHDLYDEADWVNEMASLRRLQKGPIDAVVSHLLVAAEALRAAARELDDSS